MSRVQWNIAAIAVAALASSSLAPVAAHAQWRAEASVAAGRTTLPARGGVPSPFAGTFTAGVAGSLVTRGRWRLELVGDAGHEALAGGSGGDARTVARIAWSRDGSGGLLLEGGGSVAWRSRRGEPDAIDPDTTRLALLAKEGGATVAPLVRGLTGGIGAWTRARGVLLTASARTTTLGSISQPFAETRYRMVDSALEREVYDSVRGYWKYDTTGYRPVARAYTATGERVRRLLQTDLSLAAASSVGAFGFSATGGVRQATLGGGGQGWGTLRATWDVRGDLALSLQAARLAADMQRSLPARRELQLGVLLRPWGPRAQPIALPASAAPAARRFAAEPRDDGRVTLVVHAPGARSVELMGDFTAWRIVTLARGRGDTWRVTLDVARGVHQVNLRVDGGAWGPPPGLGVGDDGFGGTFGLLVL